MVMADLVSNKSCTDTVGGGSASLATSSCGPHPAQQIRIGKRFRLLRRLGGGAFGEVYVGADLVTEEYVAIKLEPIVSMHQPHLYHEARLYQLLTKGLVTVGIPKIRFFGREGEYNALVMDLLGPSLEDLFDYCGRKFDLKTVCQLGIQMVHRLEFLHSMGFLHRDLKPENFVMGCGRRAHHVYMIDLGLAKRYRDATSGNHIAYIEGKALTGTARYVSLHTHLGRQQARRDDMESLAYILIYFASGGLPWQGVRCQNKLAKYERIKALKQQTSVDELCQGITSPAPFADFLVYTRSLAFDEAPNYKQCVGYFEDLMLEMNWEHDFGFQWTARSAASATAVSEGHSFVITKDDGSAATANPSCPAEDNVCDTSLMTNSSMVATELTNSVGSASPTRQPSSTFRKGASAKAKSSLSPAATTPIPGSPNAEELLNAEIV